MLLKNLIPTLLKCHKNYRGISNSTYMLCSETTTNTEDNFDVFEDLIKASIDESKEEEKSKSFLKLLRESKFVQLGDFKGRTVMGKIVHKVRDDLYIDIGLKFNAVVKAPEENRQQYTLGRKVIMKLFDPELSERFLGSKKDLTLLEADAFLLRLVDENK